MSIAALVVSLPERHELLCEALASVQQQTLQPDAVLIGIDPRVVGEAENVNRLARAARGAEWFAFLHDDDLWLPDHLHELAAHGADADVVVADFELVGRSAHTIERHHCDYRDLERTNWFPPAAVMMRASLFQLVGGFRDPDPARGERWVDWTMWRRCLAAGARFACSHKKTMLYRFGDWGNGSWNG